MGALAATGEESSAGGLAHAIEATIVYIGRLWVAEYLAALTCHPGLMAKGLSADIFELLIPVKRKGPLGGEWLGIIAQLRSLFLTERIPTVIEGLATIEPGRSGDLAQPLGRLLRFRNAFAHGSFLSTSDDVAEHRALLHHVISAARGLVKQPVLVRNIESLSLIHISEPTRPY